MSYLNEDKGKQIRVLALSFSGLFEWRLVPEDGGNYYCLYNTKKNSYDQLFKFRNGRHFCMEIEV